MSVQKQEEPSNFMFTKMFDVLFRDHEDDSEKLNPSA